MDWEQCYTDGNMPWEKGEGHPALTHYLTTSPLEGTILVPGCGLGHDVRALASANKAATITGLDISPTANAKADSFPKVGGEHYLLGDLFNPSEKLLQHFDHIVEHTCFCAIDPSQRAQYVKAIQQLLRPGGQVLAIYFLTPWDEGEEHEGPPHGCTTEELNHLFDPYFDCVKEWVPEHTYEGREGRELCRLLKLKN